MEKIGAVRNESEPSSEWMTLRAQAASEVQEHLLTAGAVETADRIVALQDLLERYKLKGDNRDRFAADAAAEELFKMSPSPVDEYRRAITPSPASAANDETFQVAA